MESVVINVKNNSDKKLLLELAKRLGLGSSLLSQEEKEDFAIGKAIEEGLKSGYTDSDKLIARLKKKVGK